MHDRNKSIEQKIDDLKEKIKNRKEIDAEKGIETCNDGKLKKMEKKFVKYQKLAYELRKQFQTKKMI